MGDVVMEGAPERIFTSQCGKTLVHDGMKRFETDVEYIRADHVDALLKQAREEAWREAAEVVHDDWGWDEPGSAEKAILALIEKDAPPKAKKPSPNTALHEENRNAEMDS